MNDFDYDERELAGRNIAEQFIKEDKKNLDEHGSEEHAKSENNPISLYDDGKKMSDEQFLMKLAELSELEYERGREQAAKDLNIGRVSILDRLVNGFRQIEKKEIKGRAIELYEPEQWHESVDGIDVLDEAVDHLCRHMFMSKADAYACVLWAAHTYIFDGFYHSARLLITAPEKECGKSVLLFHMIGNLVNKPQSTENITPAPFFRIAELYKPTFLIDEADAFIKQDADLSGALNGGWEPHGGVIRCVGEDQEPRHFSTFCPTAIAGIEIEKKLPGPTVSRSIIINLDRAVDGEISKENEYDARKHKKSLLETGRKLARWCNDNKQKIHKHDPVLPAGVKNRLADKWGPLFAIAEVAGGEWDNHATTALMSQVDTSEPSKSELLLVDIKSVLDKAGNIFTAILIDRLCELEESRWKEYNFKEFFADKKKIKDTQIAKLLKKYKIGPVDVKINGVTRKGYNRVKLEEVFKRYLQSKPKTPDLGATALPATDTKGYSAPQGATSISRVAPKQGLQDTDTKEGSAVAGKLPPVGQKKKWEFV